MCDCYETKCHEQGCNIIIPVHISGFCTGRDNVYAFCKKHLKQDCLVYVLPKGTKSGITRFPRNFRVGFKIIDRTKIDLKEYSFDFQHKDNKHPPVSPNTTDWIWIK